MSLCGMWSVTSVMNDALADRIGEYKDISFSGSVPGSTLNDLKKAGFTPDDIFFADNAELVQRWENYNWHYRRTFELSAEDISLDAELVFERLDTYCDIYLNGEHIAFCDNGYIEHRFKVGGVLKKGENIIDVYFYSPINYTLGKKPLPAAFTAERLYNRRIQCTYGWDWTMRFVTTGIYGDCYIEMPNCDMQISDMYIYTRSADKDAASVGFDITLAEVSGSGILDVEIISPSGDAVRSVSRYCREKFFRISLDIPCPELWYPIGYGAQPLYTVSVKYRGREIYSESFGIRVLRVLQLPDKQGSREYERCLELKRSDFAQTYDKNEEFSGLILSVNGVKILCKGANWVPLSPFETEGIEEKIKNVLALSAYAGVNMIRVWGGGYIEKKCFYDECSRLGILVLQDFFMACGAYPEKEEWFIAALRREAEYTVRLLRNQPCLAWWHGDNENAVDGCATYEDYKGRDSAYLGLAPAVWKLDPYRDFMPSSPFGGNKYASNTVGTTHNTQYLGNVFDYYDNATLEDYKEYTESLSARFISEEPCFGAASLAALERMMTREDIFGSDEAMWKYHTQNNPGLKKHLLDYYSLFAKKVLGDFSDGRDRLFKLQYMQCEHVRLSLERMRREPGFNTGVIFWMLADCWPAACGWSLIDFYCGAKPALYAFRRACRDIAGAFGVPKNGELPLTVGNISTAGIKARYRVMTVNGFAARELVSFTDIELGGGESLEVKLSLPYEDELLICEVCDERGDVATAFYKNGALGIERAVEGADYTVRRSERGVTVTALTYLQAVCAECRDTGVLLNDNYFIMLPRESREISALSGELCDAEIICYKLKRM